MNARVDEGHSLEGVAEVKDLDELARRRASTGGIEGKLFVQFNSKAQAICRVARIRAKPMPGGCSALTAGQASFLPLRLTQFHPEAGLIQTAAAIAADLPASGISYAGQSNRSADAPDSILCGIDPGCCERLQKTPWNLRSE